MAARKTQVKKKPAQNGEYTAKDIQVLEGLEAVRRRPGMYIGSTDSRGLHHLIYEIVDNSIDEAMAGVCTHIWINIQKDGHVLVRDNGRGIPIGKHPKTGKSALETVMTYLHAGGKFGGGAYKVSGGLHGVGASVVNALSSETWVEVHQKGKIYRQEYARGKVMTKLQTVKTSKYPYDNGSGPQTGSITCFLPDADIFETLDYDFQTLTQRLREVAYLTKGVWIQFVDERTDRELNFYFEGGVSSFVRHLNRDREVLHSPPIYVDREVKDMTIEAAIQYNEGYSEAMYSFANCINTIDGGSHLTGFRSALTRVLNDYGRKSKQLKDGDPNLTGEDTREGLVAVISVKLGEPQFEGQTKTRLGNPEVKGLVESAITEELSSYLEEHPSEARKIIDKCVITSRARDAARKAKDLVVRKGLLDGSNLPGKLADCSDREPENCELYIVEGPSAGGSAKAGRDRRFQAILPLRGKILNIEKARLEKMLSHEELRVLISAMGCGFGENLDLEKLRYHRVIIMTDADVDGAHIRTLLLTFFFRYYQPLIDAGYLYIAQPPLFKLTKGKVSEWIFSDREFADRFAKLSSGDITVASMKGVRKITGGALRELLDAYKKYENWMEHLERRGASRFLVDTLLTAAVEKKKSTLNFGREDAQEFMEELDKRPGIKVRMEHVTGTESYEITLSSTGKNGSEEMSLDQDLLGGSEIAGLLEVFPQVKQLKEAGPYKVMRRDKEVVTDVDWQELEREVAKLAGKSGLTVQRYKGLGEMNADQLWDTTMDPDRRTLLRVDIENAMEADLVFSQLMGEEVAPRKKFIMAHGVEATVDA